MRHHRVPDYVPKYRKFGETGTSYKNMLNVSVSQRRWVKCTIAAPGSMTNKTICIWCSYELSNEATKMLTVTKWCMHYLSSTSKVSERFTFTLRTLGNVSRCWDSFAKLYPIYSIKSKKTNNASLSLQCSTPFTSYAVVCFMRRYFGYVTPSHIHFYYEVVFIGWKNFSTIINCDLEIKSTDHMTASYTPETTFGTICKQPCP